MCSGWSWPAAFGLGPLSAFCSRLVSRFSRFTGGTLAQAAPVTNADHLKKRGNAWSVPITSAGVLRSMRTVGSVTSTAAQEAPRAWR